MCEETYELLENYDYSIGKLILTIVLIFAIITGVICLIK